MSEKPARRSLDEIFGVEPWSERERHTDSGEERRRERELLENRPPHHDARPEDRLGARPEDRLDDRTAE